VGVSFEGGGELHGFSETGQTSPWELLSEIWYDRNKEERATAEGDSGKRKWAQGGKVYNKRFWLWERGYCPK